MNKQFKKSQWLVLVWAFTASWTAGSVGASPKTASSPAEPKATTAQATPRQSGAQSAGLIRMTPEEQQGFAEFMKKSTESVNLVKLGDAAAQRGNWSEAHTQYQQALDAWPDNPNGLYGMGQCAAQSGDLTRAITYYRKAIYTDEPGRFGTIPGDGFQENSVKRLMEFALLLNRANQVEEATFIYNRAASLLDYEPVSVASYRAIFTQGVKPAVKVLLPELVMERTLPDQVRYTPEHLQALADVALTHEELSFGSSEATAHMQEAVKLYPDSSVVYYYLGEVLDAVYYHGSPQTSHLPEDLARAKAAYQKAIDFGDDATVAAAKERLSMIP